jgi:Domain of unknown function (DUF4124)
MKLIAVLSLLLVVPVYSYAQAYKCKQADGQVSFQDQPCRNGSPGTTLNLRTPAPIEAQTEPTTQQTKRPKSSISENERDVQQQRADAAVKAQSQQIEALNRSVKCDRARNNLGALKTQRPAYSLDNSGNKKYIDDSARQSEIDTTQRAVAQNCN